MDQEDTLQSEANHFPRRFRRRWTFGRNLQLAAAGESSMATAENWSEICHSLQEKLSLVCIEAEVNRDIYDAEKEHHEHDYEYILSLARNFQTMADDLDILRQKAVEYDKCMRKLKTDHNRLTGFYYIRDWRCKELWTFSDWTLLVVDLTSVLEDSLVVLPRPSDDDSIPPKKIKEEEH